MARDQDIINAVKSNDPSTLQKLLQKASKQTTKTKIIGNSKKLNINFQDADGTSALHQAAVMSSVDMLQILLDNGASLELKDNKGMTALHFAAWQGSPQTVQLLLHKGSSVNEQAINGDTPLHLACQHGHFDVATLLLNHQADPTICNKDLRTSLDVACQFGFTRIVELLLRSNLCQKLLEDSPTDLLSSNRTTCLHLAAMNGHLDVLKLLLQAGMNINRTILKGTCLHVAAVAGNTEVVRFLIDHGVDVNKRNANDQTVLDILLKLPSTARDKELIHLVKEAGRAVYSRAVTDYSSPQDSGSLAFREGDIIRVVERSMDAVWRGHVYQEGRLAKTGSFPAQNVVLIDSKVVTGQDARKHLHSQVPDLLHRGPSYSSCGSSSISTASQHYNSSSDRGSMESSSTDDGHSLTSYSFPCTTSSNFPPPQTPSAMLASYPPRSPVHRDFSGADSGFSSLHSLPHFAPSSPAPSSQQFSKSPFVVSPNLSGAAVDSLPCQISVGNGCVPDHGERSPAAAPLPTLGGVVCDMRGSSPSKDSPGHSNRNSAASSDSGRGHSTGHADVKPSHNFANAQAGTQQHRLSDQSYESGVSSRQSYHSTSSSSHGSLDLLEEQGTSSTINVTQLIQAGVPDNEVLHAWLHDLHFEEYYPLFVQAGYDLPTISRMTPEDLTAVGITKPAHRKRLKTEIARLNIPDGIPDYRPNDLMEWLHLLGLGDYLDTLCGQGYDSIDYVTDITWEDLEEIGIRKLGHQKKIMLAIDRLKRITSGVKSMPVVDGRTASLELLEPPPPAPPITGRWSEGDAPSHVYDGALIGARPKKSPSGDSISTTTSSGSGSSAAYNSGRGGIGSGGDIKVISHPRDDAGLAGAVPYRHGSTGSAGSSLQPDVVAVQVKKNMRSSTSDDKRDVNGQQLMCQSFQGSPGGASENEVFSDNTGSRNLETDSSNVATIGGSVIDRHKLLPTSLTKSGSEKFEQEDNSDGHKGGTEFSTQIKNSNGSALRVETGEHIYDTPQICPPPKSPKPLVMPKPASSFTMAGPLHVSITSDPSLLGQASPSPGGKRGKKVPPPPPVRTHSIRAEAVSEATPSSPSKTPIAPTVITVSASVHPQPSNVIISKPHSPAVMQKPHSPAVMQKPQKIIIPNATSKLQQQHIEHQYPLSPLVAQKPTSPKPLPPKVVILPTSASHPHSPTPSQGTQHMPVFCKPQGASQQHVQPKSPLPVKSVMNPNVPKQQHQLPQLLPQSSHNKVLITSTTQPLGTTHQPKVQAAVLPSQHFGSSTSALTSQQRQPQVQAFASCVKSLSEKFGKNTKEEDDDQFPDNASTDSDDFPPPPPPIAMDIITPKIHNYGIPSSKDRGKEFGLHQRQYLHKSRPSGNASSLSSRPSGEVSSLSGPVGPADLTHTHLNHPQGQYKQTPMVITPTKTLPEHLTSVQLRKQPLLSPSSISSPGSDRELTPELDSLNAISKEKRSESTTSFESNSSSSSIDSNTLPFANENVGTIKQRSMKPVTAETENGKRNEDSGLHMLDSDIHRNIAGYSNSSVSPAFYSEDTTSSVNDASKILASEIQSQRPQHQLSHPTASTGKVKPPVPSKKPELSPKKARPQPTELTTTSPKTPLVEEAVTVREELQTGNVLTDIDNMLQGLTDELDAMLEEEMAS